MAKRIDRDHPSVQAARDRVRSLIDTEPAERLARAVRDQPSLRGMVAGYLAESRFQSEILLKTPGISDISTPDDHDRSANKADRLFKFRGRVFSVQVKSIQTNSIGWNIARSILAAVAQNDASDRREVKIKATGHTIETTCYLVGEYNFLAVPLYPFTGDWTFAYKRNRDCRRTQSKKYKPEDQKYLLASTEIITFPVGPEWSSNLTEFLGRWR